MTTIEKVHELEDRLASVKKAGRMITLLVAIVVFAAGAFMGKQLAETDGYQAGYNAGYSAGFEMSRPGEGWR